VFKELGSEEIEMVKNRGANRRVVPPFGKRKKLIATFKAISN
jgi:hypothetical protein